ncbi:phage major capsid protein [Ethanoligenens sp.]|uniref:phage major capsid protein n=1 Tax=Ethanoligenens sp. TaxID=2099655 RepID=UPI0039E7BE6D
MHEKRLKEIFERLNAIESRKAEIRSLLTDETKKVNLDELQTELEGLDTESRGLSTEQADLERRRQIADGINTGVITGNPINPPVPAVEKRDFGNMPKEELLSTPEYRSAFFKMLQCKPLTDAEKRAYDSSTTAVIPTQTSDILFQKMVKVAPLLNEITLLRVAGNIKFAVQGTRDNAANHTENTAITPAADTLVYVQLGGYDYTKLIVISKTISTMAIPAFEGWITDMLSQDIAVKIEDASINGTGSSEPKGVTNATMWAAGTNLVEYTHGGSPTYDNVVDLISMLPARYSGNAKFLCNNKFLYGQLAKIKDDQKRPILVQDFSNPIAQRILGFPILISDKAPDGTMIFGDFKQMVGNLAQDVTVEANDAAGFDSRSIHYLGSAIFDCGIALTDAFVKMDEAAS